MKLIFGMMTGLCVALSGCCAPVQPEGAALPGPAPEATAPTGAVGVPMEPGESGAEPTGNRASLSVVGAWSSPSCGERRYERRIQFTERGSFMAEDRVSPCPPNVVCIWSGIVFTTGTYTVEAGNLYLHPTQAGHGAGAHALPEMMFVDPATGAPMEVMSDGSRCVYVPFQGE